MPRTLLVLLILAPLAAAELEPPLTPEEAANRVVAALAAGDEKTVAAIAARREPDAWIVADLLCSLGSADAAVALARASPAHSARRLGDYVDARASSADEAGARKTLRLAHRALGAGNAAASLDALDDLPDDASPVHSVRAALLRGEAQRALRSFGASSEAYRAAGERSRTLGWLAGYARGYAESAVSAALDSNHRAAVSRWRRVAKAAEQMSDRALLARAHNKIGAGYRNLGSNEAALGWHESAQEIYEELDDAAGAARALGNLAIVHRRMGNLEKALDLQEEALDLYADLGDTAAVAATLGNIGVIHESRGSYREALDVQQKALALKKQLRNWRGAAVTLGNIGILHQRLGAYDRALAVMENALKVYETLKDRAAIARARATLGNLHAQMGDHASALLILEEVRQRMQALRLRPELAAVTSNIGLLHRRMGDLDEALLWQRRALDAYVELKDRAGEAATLLNLGVVHEARGAYAEALRHHQRAFDIATEIGARAARTAALGSLGNVYLRLGDPARALVYQQQALALAEAAEDSVAAVAALTTIGGVLAQQKRLAEAQDALEKAWIRVGGTGYSAMAEAIGNLALVFQQQGKLERAEALQREALELKELAGDKVGAALSRVNLGTLLEARGKTKEAAEALANARDEAEELGAPAVAVRARWGFARTQLALGHPGRALNEIQIAVDALAVLVGGQAEETSARAREQFLGLFEDGVRAAMALGDTAKAAWFLESGRAGALLESLGGRAALQASVVPDALRAKETQARGAANKALALYRGARRARDLPRIRATRADLEAARGRLRDAIEAIQREAKAAADVVYPSPAPLEVIRRGLRPSDVLVLYALFERRDALALVITAKGERIVPLGPTAAIDVISRQVMPEKVDIDPAERVQRLRGLLIEPLALEEEHARVLVSPHGVLSFLPFSLLLPGREVAYVPSATTHTLLLSQRPKPGTRILALGDPDYRTGRGSGSPLGGARLQPLPGTRAEANAVGTDVRLGPQATESGFAKALTATARWRAIHLACHGLVNTERPMLSSLALTPEPESDGFLTAQEVFRMKVPADLVVLSACETGRGAVYKAEGIVGLTRAFMFAGSPRVIVSLWKVDDEATRELMIKFYELWAPKEATLSERSESQGRMGAAAALRAAQAHVRSHAKWRHPYYWAAWVLWGLAD